MAKSDRASHIAAVKSAEKEIVSLVSEENGEQDTFSELMNRLMGEHETKIGTLYVRLALQVHIGARAKDSLSQDWRPWAKGKLAGLRKPFSPPRMYGLRNAGAIAEIIGESVGEASYLALVPFYRLLVAAGTPEEIEASQARIRELWAECVAEATEAGMDRVTEERARQKVEAIAPSGTRGSKGKNAAERKKSQQAKNARSRQPKNEPTKTTENEGEGNVSTVEVEPAAVEACTGVVETIVKGMARKTKTDETIIRLAMLAAVRIAQEHGLSTLLGVLSPEAK